MSTLSLGLRVDLPPGFVRLPVDASAAERAEQIGRIVDAAARPGRDIGGRDQVAAGIGELVDLLGELNVQVFGRFAVATGGGPAAATLQLSVQRIEVADRQRAAEDPSLLAGATMAIFRRRNPQAQTRVVDLPIGPAMAGLVFGELTLPAERTGADRPVSVPTFRAVFLVPMPTGEHLVALDVATSSEPGWPEISRQAVAVARSLSLGEPAA